MNLESVDIVVIGGGAGGTPAAVRAAQLGAKVVLIEKKHLGGACMNRGCIPVKTLMETARLYRALGRAGDFGLKVSGVEVDWEALMGKKDQTVNYLRLGTESILKSNGVEIVRGRASFSGPNRIRVEAREFEAKGIIVSTGSEYRPPQIEGIEAEGVITPDDVLSMREFPASVAVIGSGPVELEMAQYLSLFGVKVTVVEKDKRILPDKGYRDLSGRLAKELRGGNLEILTRTKVSALRKKDGALALTLKDKDGEKELVVSRLLHANRAPALEGLEVQKAGLETDKGRLKVGSDLRTSVKSVFAGGDVTGGAMFSHKAAAMGLLAAENSLGRSRPFDGKNVIRGLTTWPEAAAVGLSEKEAKKEGYEVLVGTIPYGVNAMGMISLETQGAVKVVAEAGYGQVLGVHVIGPKATELISEGALAVEMEATLEDLAAGIRYHPSLSESQTDAAREALGRGIYVMR